MLLPVEQRKAKQSRAEQSRAKQSRAEQSTHVSHPLVYESHESYVDLTVCSYLPPPIQLKVFVCPLSLRQAPIKQEGGKKEESKKAL